MYCPSCGEEIPDDSEFCRHCGESLSPSVNQDPSNAGDIATDPSETLEPEEAESDPNQWNPKYPIISVFASIMLLWTALEYEGVSNILIFGVPAVLIIPRVRRNVVSWVQEQFNEDPTSKGAIIAIGAIYAILMGMATLLIIGSTANDPTVSGSPAEQLTVGLLTIGIMFVIAVAIVTAMRVNRKLQG